MQYLTGLDVGERNAERCSFHFTLPVLPKNGAANGTRTRDPKIHNLVL